MKVQPKISAKLIVSICLVTIFVFTAIFGCNFSVPQAQAAATPNVTYHVLNPSGAELSTHQEDLTYGLYLTWQPTAYKWFRFDSWYTDSDCTTPAPTVVTVVAEAPTNLYGKYTLDVGAGDVNGDGIVNTADILVFRKQIVGGYDLVEIQSGAEWAYVYGGNWQAGATYYLHCAADLNKDAEQDIRDVATIRMATVGGYGNGIFQNFDVTGQAVDDGSPNDWRTLYFFNAQDWKQVYAYAYRGETYRNAAFPGEQMKPVAGHDGWYSIQVKTNLTSVIFDCGLSTGSSEGIHQTTGITIDSSKPYYCTGAWYSTFTTTQSVYFHDSSNWSSGGWGNKVFANTGFNGTNSTANFASMRPGLAMTAVDGKANWFEIKLATAITQVQFNNGDGYTSHYDQEFSQRTPTLTISPAKCYYCTGAWYNSFVDTITLHLWVNDTGWKASGKSGYVFAHCWDNPSGTDDGNFPGTPMIEASNNWFEIDVPAGTKIIFGNGKSSGQTDNVDKTGDMTINANATYIYMQKDAWYSDSWKAYRAVWMNRNTQPYDAYVVVNGTTYYELQKGWDNSTEQWYIKQGSIHLNVNDTIQFVVWGYEYYTCQNSNGLTNGKITVAGNYQFYVKTANAGDNTKKIWVAR